MALQFGYYNFRELNKKEGQLLYKLIIEHGIRRYHLEHAIPIVVTRNMINQTSLLQNPGGVSSIGEIKWTPEVLERRHVIAAGGRHRKYAAEMYHNNVNRATDSLRAALDKKTPESTGYSEMKMDLDNMIAAQRDCQWWLVVVYDKGTFS